MNKEIYAHSTTWDYIGWKDKYKFDERDFQNDWNRTFITKINFISAYIHKESRNGKADIIKIHPSLEFILGDEFYNKDTKTLSTYSVILDDDIDANIVYVYKEDYSNPKMVPVVIKEEDENGWGEIKIKPTKNAEGFILSDDKIDFATDEEISDYSKNCCGYIEILNLKI